MEQVLESTQLIYSARQGSSHQLLIKSSEKHEEMRPVPRRNETSFHKPKRR